MKLLVLLLLTITAAAYQCRDCDRRQEVIDVLKKYIPHPDHTGSLKVPDPSPFIDANADLLSAYSEIDEYENPVTKKLLLAYDPYREMTISDSIAAFDLNPKVIPYEIIQARLFIYMNLRGHEIGRNRSFEINVHQIDRDNKIVKLLAHKTTSIETPAFVIIDLAPEDMESWRRNNGFGLTVEAFIDGRNVAVHPQDDMEERNMMLDLSVRGVDKSRTRRSNDLCGYGITNGTCCREDMVVNFREIGWDFVISPGYFNAYKCGGACDKISTTNLRFSHSVVTQRRHPGSLCCHAVEYTPLRLLYRNSDNSLTVAMINNLVASKCSCG